MSKKSKDKELSNKNSFFKKIKLSFDEFILKIDEKTNPKVGYVFYRFFKLITKLSFFIGFPLFVIFYSWNFTIDSYVFSTIEIQKKTSFDGIVDYIPSNKTSNVIKYSQIDSSISELAANDITENNVFLQTYNQNTDSSEKNYLFYGVFFDSKIDELSGQTNFDNSLVNDSNEEILKTWLTSFELTSDDTLIHSSFLDYLYDNSSAFSPDGDSQILNPSDAQKAFRTIFKPMELKDISNDVEKNGAIIGWTFVGVLFLFSLGWFWFSKFSEVKIKEEKEG